MSKNYETIKNYYDTGAWTKEMVYNTVGKTTGITLEEYTEITGDVIDKDPNVVVAPFKQYDFQKEGKGVLYPVTSDTEVEKIDITLSDEILNDWAIAGLAKYEFLNGNARIDAIPCFEFSMEGQRILRCGFRTSGTTEKQYTKIQGALLLQRR